MKRVVIKLKDKKRKTLNLVTLRRQGLSWEEIETMLSRNLQELDNQVEDIEWTVDVTAVANIVQPQTNKMLKNL